MFEFSSATTTASIMSFTYISFCLCVRVECASCVKRKFWRTMGKKFQWIIHSVVSWKWLGKAASVSILDQECRRIFKCDQRVLIGWHIRVWCHNNHISTNYSYVVKSLSASSVYSTWDLIKFDMKLLYVLVRFGWEVSHYWPKYVDLWLDVVHVLLLLLSLTLFISI